MHAACQILDPLFVGFIVVQVSFDTANSRHRCFRHPTALVHKKAMIQLFCTRYSRAGEDTEMKSHLNMGIS